MGESTGKGFSPELEQKIHKRIEWQTQRRGEIMKDFGPLSAALGRIDAYVAALKWVLEIGGASAKQSQSGKVSRDEEY